jgi:hypothetical protein
VIAIHPLAKRRDVVADLVAQRAEVREAIVQCAFRPPEEVLRDRGVDRRGVAVGGDGVLKDGAEERAGVVSGGGREERDDLVDDGLVEGRGVGRVRDAAGSDVGAVARVVEDKGGFRECVEFSV